MAKIPVFSSASTAGRNCYVHYTAVSVLQEGKTQFCRELRLKKAGNYGAKRPFKTVEVGLLASQSSNRWFPYRCDLWRFVVRCMLLFNENETIGCSCNHTTSFSILMSPHNPDHSELVIISFIGVGFSIASLIICLIIEGILWKTIGDNMTSYFRHISIINIAVSLLIANIWFIIVATIPKMKNAPVCTSVTFFIHFFYLALFFWMLASALLLLYRMISVFDGGLSKMSMLAIGFSLGYGAPLIIATITIAVTAPSNEYIRNNVCWLNWKDSKAMLGFVIPALLIVGVNLIILFVVISKMLMRRVSVNAAQTGERHVLMVIVRSLAVLTPFFGLTWGLGYGTMFAPENRWIHIAFAFFNSLQIAFTFPQCQFVHIVCESFWYNWLTIKNEKQIFTVYSIYTSASVLGRVSLQNGFYLIKVRCILYI
uniref:G-protein coupled receptors family 2 profile 2 domain-containing protein n=1 Tax=Cyprinodon variegatus TaxID=28743 RepID=A0A3Q2EE55_CYPVA